MRPEIIVPDDTAVVDDSKANLEGNLDAGTLIRCIREPYLVKLPKSLIFPELVVIETGAKVRIMTIRLSNGEVVTVPRANVELIEG